MRGEMERELRAMGAINLTAIEECAEVEGRFAFLRGQQEDLEQGNAPATASDVQALREEVRRLREQLDSRHGSPLDPGPPA